MTNGIYFIVLLKKLLNSNSRPYKNNHVISTVLNIHYLQQIGFKQSCGRFVLLKEIDWMTCNVYKTEQLKTWAKVICKLYVRCFKHTVHSLTFHMQRANQQRIATLLSYRCKKIRDDVQLLVTRYTRSWIQVKVELLIICVS